MPLLLRRHVENNAQTVFFSIGQRITQIDLMAFECAAKGSDRLVVHPDPARIIQAVRRQTDRFADRDFARLDFCRELPMTMLDPLAIQRVQPDIPVLDDPMAKQGGLDGTRQHGVVGAVFGIKGHIDFRRVLKEPCMGTP